MEPIDPASATAMNSSAKIINEYEAIDCIVGIQIGTAMTRRKKTAGNKSDSGTLVRAPISATKSLKKGMALETKNAMTDKVKVKISHRILGLLFKPHQ